MEEHDQSLEPCVAVNEGEDNIKDTERKMYPNAEQSVQETKDGHKSVGERVNEGVIAIELDDAGKDLEDKVERYQDLIKKMHAEEKVQDGDGTHEKMGLGDNIDDLHDLDSCGEEMQTEGADRFANAGGELVVADSSIQEVDLSSDNNMNDGNLSISINNNGISSFPPEREAMKELAVIQVEKDNVQHIQRFRRRLGMRYAHYNYNGKLWFFVNDNMDVEIMQDLEQQITVKLLFQEWNKSLMVTMVYSKCDHMEIIRLWDSLYSLDDHMDLPWLVGGDFNVIMSKDEKIGGLPVFPNEYEDFAFCINSCELFDINYKGSLFTWWNGKAGSECIFKRLDRMIANSKLQDWFVHMEVEHLSRTGSDHALLLFTCGEISHHIRKPFRFLKFWTEHESFLEVVNQAWSTDFESDEFISFKLKLKKVKTALSAWSKSAFGDIFKQLIVREEVERIKEKLYEEDSSPMNRMVLQQAQAKLKKYVHYEEEFWRQKSYMTSFAEGDRNTRYFHSIVNGRRKRLQIKRIQNQQGIWIKGDSLLAEEACFDLLQHVPSMVDQDTNNQLVSMPTLEEVKKVVFESSADSAGGPDGMIGIFYQYGFVKGRCIIENVLLTQEVVTDIRLMGEPANVVLKLDMAKAYDRVSWSYLIRVLRKMGFAEVFIDMVWRLIANKWYSILLNGQASGFFHSTRGVKQGDPLFPALFILSAEVLSRALNSLFKNNEFRSYGMPKWSASLNHLAYADDKIIYSFADSRSLELIMEVLHYYEQRHFSFYIFGLSVTHSRKRKADYNDLIKKVKNRLQTWKGRLLSFGGKVVLITNVLMSMPIHLFLAIKPPKCVINDLHKIFARFFWNNSEKGRRRHWSSYLNLCMQKEEGGVGFRCIFDVSKALCAKLWWKFRTTNTLWENYMWIKYCKRHSPQNVQWKGGS
ncbi:uncharacterized protein LOC132644099 [Lycium barbarum]|uniref:uncharacterized protein LOC132644099 n=1 Tax=Lycium barbarum TaxID=112863 RepID=UPI00293EBB16|nr:uncharacterized protein LOC132644099 [Lycium barbarum]